MKKNLVLAGLSASIGACVSYALPSGFNTSSYNKSIVMHSYKDKKIKKVGKQKKSLLSRSNRRKSKKIKKG